MSYTSVSFADATNEYGNRFNSPLKTRRNLIPDKVLLCKFLRIALKKVDAIFQLVW